MIKNLVKSAIGKTGYELVNKNADPEVIFEQDKGFLDLYNLAQEKCQMTSTDNLLRRQRHYVLNQLVQKASIREGSMCELGCWRGLSSYQLAHYIKKNELNSDFHIFDSFQGLSDYEEIDVPVNNTADLEERKKQFACSLSEVQANLGEFDFIQYHSGWIPEKFHEVENGKFSFVHIDVDLYQPITDSFDFFYPRLVEGGIMVFDDYGYTAFPGAKKAVDECLERAGNPFFISLPSGQAFLVKNI